MDEDWESMGAERISELPTVRQWPRLSNHTRMVEMFSEMGVLGSAPLHDAYSDRQEATTPGPSFDIDNVNIETSALRMPWWKDVSMHQSLLPGL